MLLHLARTAFLLMVASLAVMKLSLDIGGLPAIAADLLFLVTFGLWAAALATGQAHVRWHPAMWLLVVYLAAMALSALRSPVPLASGLKLMTQVYLLSLPLLAFNLIDSRDWLRRLCLTWVAAAGVLGLVGIAAILLFPWFGRGSALDALYHNYGTLREGPYPRLELSFVFPAMLANYLAASLMLLLLAERQGWVGRRVGWLVGTAMLVTALFGLTPGFGGVMFMLGLWAWAVLRGTRPIVARAAMFGGIAAAAGAVLAASFTPILHGTAPFLIQLPGLPPLAPSVRLLVWIDAVRNFIAAPLLGGGYGADAVHVPYESPSGPVTIVTDAHNSFLNIAAQCGLAGLAALVAIIACAARRMRPQPTDLVRYGLALAFVSGIAVQGMVGAFEDARHLWILFGLMLAADAGRYQAPGMAARSPSLRS